MLRFVVEFTFLSCGIRCKSPRCEARAFLCAWVGVGIGIGIGRAGFGHASYVYGAHRWRLEGKPPYGWILGFVNQEIIMP